MKVLRHWGATWVVIGLSLAGIVLALAADKLGFDADQRWGPFRTAMLAAAVAALALVGLLFLVDSLDRRLLARQRPGDGAVHHGAAAGYPMTRRPATAQWLGLAGFLVAMELLYAFFVSVGNWTAWPKTTEYYDMLAGAFIRGETALPIEPDPRLAELEDPYLTKSRRGIPVVRDLSYFDGKYYMYWGPTPAGLAAPWKLATGQHVGDEQVVFLASSLMLVFSVLIILDLKRRYFPAVPGWLLGCGLLIVATAHPVLWSLNHPLVHEAAAASAQAFLLGGLYFVLPALAGEEVPGWRLGAAGGMWALALGSRLLVIGAVGVLAIGALAGWARTAGEAGRWQRMARGLLWLGLPLAVGLGLLGLYNYARFGDPLETGFLYVVNEMDMNALSGEGHLFTFSYALPNLLYYFATPVRLLSVFPFTRPVWGAFEPFASFLRRFDVPQAHHPDTSTGYLMVVPFVLFALPLAGMLILRIKPETWGGRQERTEGLRRTGWSLLLGSLAAMVPLLLFFWVSVGYLTDWTRLMVIFAVLGAWAYWGRWRSFPIRGRLTVGLLVAAIAISVGFSVLLALTGSASRFDDENPALWNQMIRLFSG
jgi:hypothetical protein